MPKRLKKKALDPNVSAFAAVQKAIEMAGDSAAAPPFKAQLSEYMRALGRKGGKASGAKRMSNLSEKARKEIAAKAAAARWAKRPKPKAS